LKKLAVVLKDSSQAKQRIEEAAAQRKALSQN